MGSAEDAATFMGACHTGDPVADGAAQTHVRCAAENADVQLGKMLDAVEALDASDGGETMVVLTADHGATYGEHFYGKDTAGAGDSNWYYAPTGVWDAGSFIPATDPLYNQPSPSLQPLIATGNIQFSYQSSAIEAWLINHSTYKKKLGASAMLKTPGVIASYWRDGGALPPARHQRDDPGRGPLVEATRPGAREHDGCFQRAGRDRTAA